MRLLDLDQINNGSEIEYPLPWYGSCGCFICDKGTEVDREKCNENDQVN